MTFDSFSPFKGETHRICFLFTNAKKCSINNIIQTQKVNCKEKKKKKSLSLSLEDLQKGTNLDKKKRDMTIFKRSNPKRRITTRTKKENKENQSKMGEPSDRDDGDIALFMSPVDG